MATLHNQINTQSKYNFLEKVFLPFYKTNFIIKFMKYFMGCIYSFWLKGKYFVWNCNYVWIATFGIPFLSICTKKHILNHMQKLSACLYHLNGFIHLFILDISYTIKSPILYVKISTLNLFFNKHILN